MACHHGEHARDLMKEETALINGIPCCCRRGRMGPKAGSARESQPYSWAFIVRYFSIKCR
jgi:hypothetical protein